MRIEEVFRRESGQVLASLIGSLGDFDLAEDAPRLVAVQATQVHGYVDLKTRIGRTSTVSTRAEGTRAATAMASSRSLASMR